MSSVAVSDRVSSASTTVHCHPPGQAFIATSYGEGPSVFVTKGVVFDLTVAAHDVDGRPFSNCSALITTWDTASIVSTITFRSRADHPEPSPPGSCATDMFLAAEEGVVPVVARAEGVSSPTTTISVYSPFEITAIAPPVVPLPLTKALVFGVHSQVELTVSGGSPKMAVAEVAGDGVVQIWMLDEQPISDTHVVRVECLKVGTDVLTITLQSSQSIPGLVVDIACVIPHKAALLPVAWEKSDQLDQSYTTSLAHSAPVPKSPSTIMYVTPPPTNTPHPPPPSGHTCTTGLTTHLLP